MNLDIKTRNRLRNRKRQLTALWIFAILICIRFGRAILSSINEYKDLVLTISTVAIAVFTYTLWKATIGLYKMALKQSKDTEASLNVSKDAVNAAVQANNLNREIFLASERPWIPAKVETVGSIRYDENGLNIIFRFKLKNIGKSPAKHVWIYPRLVASILGQNNDLLSMQKELSEQAKKMSGVTLGHTIFPNDVFVQDLGMSFNKEQIAEAAKGFDCLLLSLVGVIDYSFVFEEGHHQSGFIFEVRRLDVPRPMSDAKNRNPSVICPDEGDIAPHEIVLRNYFLGGFFAD
jgi:hypothetical protein